MERKIGSNVDAWCGRCKLVLAHTVEAMVETKISRVHCNTCGAQHAYKANAPGSGRARGVGSRSKTGKPDAPPVDYAAMVRGKDARNATPYAMQARFQPNELVNHSTFGVGLVLKVRDNTKIEVAFESGLKVLAQGRA